MGSRSVVATVAFLSLLSWPSPATAQESVRSLAIVGATIMDGHGGAPIVDGTIVIEGDGIAAVGSSADVAVPAGAEVIDGSGKFVTPGFVDTNVHMSLAFGRGTRVEEHAEGDLATSHDPRLARRRPSATPQGEELPAGDEAANRPRG
ncbi:MAG: hypothetical protein OXI39_12170 [Gemmatimonadota bacterium]|uniref:amidohydrolase family protein n=1 Tax=Candidatus Palauibacter scopulicola TaxID=3056741 RepID=UPI0023A6BE43|nr:hypothetical protein [Candidatus Palauibacter scopulicola]MDE2663743.1 hypothetical protein [Candidatus Palauibacter scopulicola]